MEVFQKYVAIVDAWLWGYFLMFLLIGAGLYLTVRLGFVQFRYFLHGWSCVSERFDNPDDKGEGTYFQALSTALSATNWHRKHRRSCHSYSCGRTWSRILDVDHGPCRYERQVYLLHAGP
jgi:hypothetical protein